MHPGIAILALWIGWAVSWLVAARWSSATESRPALRGEIGYRITMVLGGLLMAIPARRTDGPHRLWHVGWTGAWICVALVAAGIAYAWWARVHLGRLWSSGITRKTGHHVVDSGPYAQVRHPIYTGLLLSLVATAAAKGTLLGSAALALLWLGIWMKAREEERWLSAELGEAYTAYRRRVPMLVPFWPVARSGP